MTVTEQAHGLCEEPAAVGTIERALRQLSGKWTLRVLWELWGGTLRFNELRRRVPGVTQHMLTSTLRDLEAAGLVLREVYPDVPPRVQYTLSEEGRRLQPVFHAVIAWSKRGEPSEDRGA